MLRHVALFAWTSGTTAAQRQEVTEALLALRAEIPEIRDFRFGPDAGINEGNHDFAVVADFDDDAGYLAYRDHPEHQRVLHEIVGPLLAARAAVQYDAGPTAAAG